MKQVQKGQPRRRGEERGGRTFSSRGRVSGLGRGRIYSMCVTGEKRGEKGGVLVLHTPKKILIGSAPMDGKTGGGSPTTPIAKRGGSLTHGKKRENGPLPSIKKAKSEWTGIRNQENSETDSWNQHACGERGLVSHRGGGRPFIFEYEKGGFLM